MSTLDLHGYRIQEAWQEFHTFINDEVTDGNRKYSVVITGNGEMKQEFDDEFVQFARLNAKYNDERFVVKNRINEHYDSTVREQKAYDRLYNTD